MPHEPNLGLQKQQFIDVSEKKLRDQAVKIQRKVARQVKAIILSLDVDDQGKIIFTQENIAKVEAINEVFRRVSSGEMVALGASMTSHMTRISGLNSKYFNQIVSGKIADKVEAKEISKRLLRSELGLTKGGTLKFDGFLSQFIKDSAIRDDIKTQLFRSITGTSGRDKLVKDISVSLVGSKTSSGAFENHLTTHTLDLYNNFDSTTGFIFADKLGLMFFRYQNSLVVDSRCFCIQRARKVFHVSETKSWVASTTKAGKKACKAIYPAADYQPLVHRGGFRCRHWIDWISKERAARVRPEFRELFPKEFEIKK